MTTFPQLFSPAPSPPLPRRLLSDLRLDGLLSENALSLLCRPCGEDEIRRRQQVFACMEDPALCRAMTECLSALEALESACLRLNASAPTLTLYCLHARRLSAYLNACELLARTGTWGELFAETSTYFAHPETAQALDALREDLRRLEELLLPLRRGLLAAGGGYRLFPDDGAISEEEELTACITALGLTPPNLHPAAVPLPPSLSNAILALCPEAAAEIEEILARQASTDFLAPAGCIPALKFFLEIHALTARAEAKGIPHTLPAIAPKPEYRADALFDISLLADDHPIVPNDARFTEKEPFFFLIGANGGGKTTYLRALGINLLLFGAGCPIFARSARIYPFPHVDAHFPADERFTGTGRLEDEARRTDTMLAECGGMTAFLLFNETFSGADGEIGFAHLERLAADLTAAGHFGLFVTHFHHVTDTSYPILTARITEGNCRTFRIERFRGAAASHAADILRRHGLDADSLEKRRVTRAH